MRIIDRMHSAQKREAVVACLALVIGWTACGDICFGQYLRIRDICRVKGQEENTLHGLGLVVGLKGTGDGEVPTTRALATMMGMMGNPVSQASGGALMLDELKNAKNVALVFVTATVPSEGARQGEMLDVVVNAISAQKHRGWLLDDDATARPATRQHAHLRVCTRSRCTR